MAYKQLNVTGPAQLLDRIAALESEVGSLETPGLTGTHIYAGEYVPQTTTTGTDTTPVATTIYVGELRISRNVLLTGLSYLVGSVGGTDKAIATLYDSTGAVVATSALAGTTVGTTATMQRLAFITPFQAGPGLYYVGIQINGTTARVRTQAFGDHNAGTIATQTFGTPAAITPPTTFTASTAPIVMTY